MTKKIKYSFSGKIVLIVFLLFASSRCTLFAERPVQVMSYTAAAIRAAKEVQADTLAPELFRQSGEWFFKAKREYKIKNFKLARDYADKARYLAEQSEFEALRNGGTRGEQLGGPDPMAKEQVNAPSAPAPTSE